jgi:hypothetical protein
MGSFTSQHLARWRRLALASTIGLAAISLNKSSRAVSTYYIDEDVTYSSAVSPCSTNVNLNTVTASLQTAMNGDPYGAFTGHRYVDPAAWSTDFTESCSTGYGSGGADSTYADAYSVAVFAGHGNAGFLQFQTASSGACSLDFHNNMRLGSMNGAQAVVGIWLTCDTLDIASIPGEANWEWLQQQFGFNNTIYINDNEPRDFFNASMTSSNVNAWINEFNNNGRKPAAFSYGDSPSRCSMVQTDAQMGLGDFLGSRLSGPSCGGNQPVFYYCGEYIP